MKRPAQPEVPRQEVVWTPAMLDRVQVLLRDRRPHERRRIRLDLDQHVLDFFRHRGRISHLQMNAVLRVYMETQKQSGVPKTTQTSRQKGK